MKFEITNEELDSINFYLNKKYVEINQLLTIDSATDVALYYDNKINYSKNDVEKEIECIKIIYELMQKIRQKKNNKEPWTFTRGTNIFEIDRLRNENCINRFLSATTTPKKAEENYSAKWDEPAVMYISGNSDIAYLNIDEILGIKSDEIIIAPFTNILSIKEMDEFKQNNTYNKVKNYSIAIEKQKLEKIDDLESKNLLEYILNDTGKINDRLSEVIRLKNENSINYENIRKLEQLLSKYDTEIEKKELYKDYSESEKQADLDDIERINKELERLKQTTSNVFEIIKEDNNFIENWKRNITTYLKSELSKIDEKYEAQIQILENIEEEKEKKLHEIEEEKIIEIEKSDFEKIKDELEQQCVENIKSADLLLENINNLISTQQKCARIASELDCSYSSLNNAFEIRKKAEELKEKINLIDEKRKEIIENENDILLKDKLVEMSKVCMQISTLINYLNNPRATVGKRKITRFDEIQMIEENELKRNIFKYSLDTRGNAELRKLQDDLEILEEKSPFKKIIGLFTGRNKLDELLIEQIGIMESTIKSTLAKSVRLDYNYSIHNIIAEIQMFIYDNKNDELIQDDVEKLKQLEKNLRKVFSIDDAVVEEIIFRKESRNMPIDSKISKKELIEIETYRFLNKYGYDNMENKTEEKKYYDTTANEIGRIIEYINTSKVLEGE